MLDTSYSTIRLNYTDIRKYDHEVKSSSGVYRSRMVTIPRILKFGGTGFLILELVNSVYRKESLNSGNTPLTLGIAAAVGATGFIWEAIRKKQESTGKKYRVEYIRMNSIK
jgi:hypothetical protein